MGVVNLSDNWAHGPVRGSQEMGRGGLKEIAQLKSQLNQEKKGWQGL